MRRASVVPMAGDESELADQQVGTVTHEVTMRYHGGESPKDRIIHGGRTLEIRRVIDVDERRKKVVCLCSEVVR